MNENLTEDFTYPNSTIELLEFEDQLKKRKFNRYALSVIYLVMFIISILVF